MSNLTESPNITRINYSQYPFLHIEDSPGKIAEIKKVVPPYFRVDSVIDIGSGAGLITRAIGEAYRAKVVHGLDISESSFELIRNQLVGFTEGRVIQQDYETFETDQVYDLAMFIDVLEHIEDPLAALRKASGFTRYGIIRSPLEETYMNGINRRFKGKDYKKIMEKKYGHIHHFNIDSLCNLIDKAGFDMINAENFEVPPEADILSDPIQHTIERFTWHTGREIYPNIWAGFM